MKYDTLKQKMRRYDEINRELDRVLAVLYWTKDPEDGGKGGHLTLSRIHIDTAIRHVFIDIPEEKALVELEDYKERLEDELTALSRSLKIT